MSRARELVLAAIAVVGAYAYGRHGVEPTTVERPVVVRGERTQTIVQQQREAIDADGVRAIIRQELASAKPAPPVADETKLVAARDALRNGMADGRWTDDDRARLRPLLLELTHEQADEIFDALLPALNDGQLRADVIGPPV